jgi:hypothetical protein
MTLDELISSINTLLTRIGNNRVDGSDVRQACLQIINFFASQLADIIPDWSSSATFQTDGTDDGKFCKYSDSNGRKRIFETKVDDNTNNPPPVDPNISENAFWLEVSSSASAAIPEWAAGVYGPGLVIVYHNHSTAGRGLYILLEPTRPFSSANIETEVTAGDWERISTIQPGTVIDCGAYNASGNVFPSSGGTGTAGAIQRGNTFDISVAGVLGGEAVPVGATIRAKINAPGNVLANWRIYY